MISSSVAEAGPAPPPPPFPQPAPATAAARVRWARWLAIGIALMGALVVTRATAHFNQTWDEAANVAAGMQWLREGRYTYDVQHPPLARIAIALGPALAGATAHGRPTHWTEGNAILLTGGRYDHLLALARLGTLPFFVLLLGIVWLWARSLYGERAAVLAVLLTATTPQVLALAGEATNDMALAATLCWALFAFVQWLDAPTWRRSALFAVAGAAAVTSKFSSLPFFALGALLIVLARWTVAPREPDADIPAPRPSWRELRAYWRPAVAAAVACGVLVWAVYRFHLRFARGFIPVPAPEMLDGLRILKEHNAGGHSAYLLGHVSRHGWWWYWTVAFGVKTPLAFLALAAIGVGRVLTVRRLRRDWHVLSPLLAAAAVMLVAMAAHIDIGIRHILPVYPLLAITAAGAALALWSRAERRIETRLALGALVVWQVAQAGRAYPDFLADFNALAGKRPANVLVDSNLDWGQDLRRLADTLSARQVHSLTLIYFGSTPVGAFPVADTLRLGGAAPASGWVAASETYIKGDYESCFAWLDSYTPVARIGRSMLLYHILPDTLPHKPPGARTVTSPEESLGPVLAGSATTGMMCREPRIVINGGKTWFGAAGPDDGRPPDSAAAPAGGAATGATYVSDAMLLRGASDGADWLTYGRDYSGQRYSPLTEIDTKNAGRLTLAWASQLGAPVPAQETTPVVAAGVLYYTGPLGSVVALDAGTGVELWRFSYKVAPVPTCCGAKNRGVAVYRDKVYYATLDDHLLAIDSHTGQLLWDVQTADPDSGYSMTAAPLAADGKIIVGIAGSEFGIRGRVDAYDAETGRLVWRFFTIPSPEEGGWWGRWSPTTPDGDRLPRDIAREKRDSAKYADAWRVGGGGVWNTPSYDPALRMIYFAVGNPAPNMDGSVRPGDNLYTVSVVALDIRTGKLRWYYQEVPHDMWDYDATSPAMLLDVTANGQRVPAVAQAGKVGWIYILDRRTGARIRRTQEFVPHENTFAAPTLEGVRIMPGMGGGSNFTPLSYSPRTNLMYVAGVVEPVKFILSPEPFAPGVKWQGGRHVPLEPPKGTLTAIDPNTGTVRWQTQTSEQILGSASLVTAGDVLFWGEQGGVFHAADARTGEILWSINLGAELHAPAISYEVGDTQYVAIAAGGTLFAFRKGE